MSEAFQPISERTIAFREREIATAVLKDGQGYVAFNSLYDAFGLDQKGQRQRLTRQGSYYEPHTTSIVMSIKGGPQPTLCLQASAVPVFLAGVSIKHIKDEESRELLRAFQEEVYIVLAEHFGISERVRASSCENRSLAYCCLLLSYVYMSLLAITLLYNA